MAKKREVFEIKVNGELIPAYRCTRCEEIKAFDEFAKANHTSTGRTSSCKKCYSEKARQKAELEKKSKPKQSEQEIVEFMTAFGYTVPAKACTKCGEVKPLKYFTKIQGGKYHAKECVVCIK